MASDTAVCTPMPAYMSRQALESDMSVFDHISATSAYMTQREVIYFTILTPSFLTSRDIDIIYQRGLL